MGAIEDEVGEVGELGAAPGVVVSPVPTSTTSRWDVSDAEAPIFVINVRRCHQIVIAATVRQLGMWTRSA